ncbi:MFS transporter [Nonomuraea sp. PA05]|uniref:MFS transporter n=1 Tax=Nonomuraea sp. PA05 TaxID=2604466 RepID=UPI0011D59BB8|nr:MFS transporter [Nonomuraea sp. PA05]TYB51469.1 MFS transporter [Nonomuraea sp. PA05]
MRGLPRQVWVLLSLTLITVAADFMVIPYFAVYFSQVLGLGIGFAAAVLTAFTLVSKGAQVLGGHLTDRLAPDRLLTAGFCLMVTGFSTLSIARSAPVATAGILLLGLGDGCLVIAMRYKLISGCEAGLRARVFSLTSVCFNLGSMVGPLAGVAVFAFSPSLTFACAAGIYVLSYAALRLLTAPAAPSPAPAASPGGARPALREILTHRPLLLAALLIIAFWVSFSQFQFSIPLVVTALDSVHGTTTVATLFVLNGALIVAFSLPLTRALEKLPARIPMFGGFLLTLLGFLLLAAVQGLQASYAWIYLPIVVLTVGEILFTTFASTHVAAIAPPHRLATYLGLLGLLSGLGTAMGNALTGALVPPLLTGGLPWLMWVIIAVVSALPLAALPGLRGARARSLIHSSSHGS